jgi:stalled ribosome alternative rescue factor ArfA
MRAAKMMCANKSKKPIAMKKGGNPVAKSLASPALKPKVVKPKKGKGSYSRKGKALPMSSGGKTKSKVNEAGNYTKPGMRKRIFNRIKAGGKGGAPGQWSARKAQMLASAYKKAGGGYKS